MYYGNFTNDKFNGKGKLYDGKGRILYDGNGQKTKDMVMELNIIKMEINIMKVIGRIIS